VKKASAEERRAEVRLCPACKTKLAADANPRRIYLLEAVWKQRQSPSTQWEPDVVDPAVWPVRGAVRELHAPGDVVLRPVSC
jgi:hypothetical protein